MALICPTGFSHWLPFGVICMYQLLLFASLNCWSDVILDIMLWSFIMLWSLCGTSMNCLFACFDYATYRTSGIVSSRELIQNLMQLQLFKRFCIDSAFRCFLSIMQCLHLSMWFFLLLYSSLSFLLFLGLCAFLLVNNSFATCLGTDLTFTLKSTVAPYLFRIHGILHPVSGLQINLSSRVTGAGNIVDIEELLSPMFNWFMQSRI